MLSDCIKVGDLQNVQNHIFLMLQSKGLKGGGRFGQTTPPLVDFLKDILRRYPEGGQILKELIQNAEDAGATEVRFLYDETQYGTESLWSKDMAPYQGPALYAYNDAVFTPEDWHGIQEIARSRKKDDPLKVGRFGIGFNSVYHITDVPSIFSGDQIGMLDPHQTLFGPHESGQCWNLKDDSKEINDLTDQFAPFVGEESRTGLPVHVSGFFGLTDNRRSIKWRELDQWRDPAALWNELLVANVVPKAYTTLILEAIKRMETEKNSDFPLSSERIYGLWPEKDKVRVPWKPIIEPVFKELLQSAIIYAASNRWIKVEQVCFSEMDESLEYTQSVLNYLQSSGKQIAKVPPNIASAVHLIVSSTKPVKKVTPAVVRQVLRKSGHTGPAGEKLNLLEYVLSDGVYSELIGLELLPLQNGNFIPFSSSVSEQDIIYITSEEYPRSLFPGLEGRLLSDNLKPQVLTALKEAAKSRGRPCTQLQLLTPERFARLIKEVMNTVWPSRDMVVQWYPDLSMFDDMPLIPKTLLEENETLVELIRLRTPSPVILEDESERELPEFLADIVQKVGGVALKKLDTSIQHPLLKKQIGLKNEADLEENDIMRVANNIETLQGLPVHINGCFAVTSNRKEIWKTDTKGRWNTVFMRHVIVKAYLEALCILRDMAINEKEMLKELLQNADDAKATEICFVFDPRHHPVDRIFDEKWAPLQGPALCVYNNQPFTEDDIRGIQNLGKGTKEGNPCKTGQYGIGFNSVYHITDCPSFISGNDILCIFDPHARYAPGATSWSTELGTFHQLFKHLGTEDVISTKQYVEVLSRIFKNSEGKQLDPNEMRTVKRVVSGLFKSLQNDSVKVRNDLENMRDLILYLPSQDDSK
ncbi:hypothetical protein Y1Q_0022949 [Alligator mississippiensis]|uniref:Sacsin/Nov domain-containing protein n=1 Tax=Alligator mississippiensis TaxID=8496 RepID=A0A151P736_ALLMI|nr:hypothetical protein Y1Q_0022949 [Alligator mississippiensis]